MARDLSNDRGKRMSRPQQIGKLGEDVFRLWATENHLSVTKPEFDMGIDFLCQVLAPIAGSKSFEGVGALFGAQIKTVESGKQSRFPLNRKDATDLLRQTQATGIFGVELDIKTVFFRFPDEDLMDQLQEFLQSKNATWSLPYSAMTSDVSSFGAQFLRHVNLNTQSRLRIRRANQRLIKAIPGSVLTATGSRYMPTGPSAFFMS